jgi:hypothetical protein
MARKLVTPRGMAAADPLPADPQQASAARMAVPVAAPAPVALVRRAAAAPRVARAALPLAVARGARVVQARAAVA